MKKITTAALFLAVIATTSCRKDLIGEGPVTSETRTVTNFTGIDLKMNGNVFYKDEPTWKLEISAKESVHGMLETNVVNQQLVIRYHDGKTYDADESIRIDISGPNVSSFSTNNSGNIFVTSDLQVNNVYLKTSGSGNITLKNIAASVIDGYSTMSGRITAATGSALTEKFKTDGSGRIDFSGVAARDVTAKTIGSGDIKVKVSDRLDATIDGSGSIYFSGSPLINSHIHGSGDLIHF
jgi:hypothetical protein